MLNNNSVLNNPKVLGVTDNQTIKIFIGKVTSKGIYLDQMSFWTSQYKIPVAERLKLGKI